MKKSTSPQILSKLLSFYYGNPTKDMKLIAIASDTSSPLPALIHSIISTSGEKSTIVSAASLPSAYRALSKAWKNEANFIILSAPSNILQNFPIHMLIAHGITSPTTFPAITPSFLVINRDDIVYPALKTTPAKTAIKSFGHHREADTRIDSFRPYKTAVEARLSSDNRIIDVAAFLTGDTAPSLLAAATTAAHLLGLDKDTIIEGLAAYDPPSPSPTPVEKGK